MTTATAPASGALAEKLWARTEKHPGGCWVWTGGTSSDGYGIVRRKPTQVFAHRLSWELANGPVPAGLKVRARCHDKRCVNPEHLYLARSKADGPPREGQPPAPPTRPQVEDSSTWRGPGMPRQVEESSTCPPALLAHVEALVRLAGIPADLARLDELAAHLRRQLAVVEALRGVLGPAVPAPCSCAADRETHPGKASPPVPPPGWAPHPPA